MRRSRLATLVACLVVSLSACSRDEGSGEVVYAGWNDLFMIDVAEGEIAEKVSVGSKINDIEPAGGERLLLATARGLLVVGTSSMVIEQTVPLGILDSVEYDGTSDLVYVLLHPGTDPNESNGPHKLIKLSGNDFEAQETLYLEPWTYDIFLSPSGNDIYVTQMAGRTVTRVDTKSLTASEKIRFSEGGEWEGQMVLLRHLAFAESGAPIYLVEQGEANPTCIWTYSPDTGDMRKSCFRDPVKIQGMVTSPDGSRIYANGLSEIVVMEKNGKIIARTGLEAKHRWIAMSHDANVLYLTAATGENAGRLTCVDTEGQVVRELTFSTPLNVIAVPPNEQRADG